MCGWCDGMVEWRVVDYLKDKMAQVYHKMSGWSD
jgi:hypothetical protein